MKKVLLITSLLLLAVSLWVMTPRTTLRMFETAPDFTLEDLHGRSQSLKDFRGKTIFLNFWSESCPPCKEEMPSMQALQKAMDPAFFVMMAVTADSNTDRIRNYIESSGFDFLVLFDKRGEVSRRYGVRMYPETLIINKEGRVMEKFTGAQDWTSTTSLIYFEKLVTSQRGEKGRVLSLHAFGLPTSGDTPPKAFRATRPFSPRAKTKKNS